MAEDTARSTGQNPDGVKAQKPKPAQTLISFPAKEMPHSILLVFKKYKYTSVEEGYPLLKAKRTGSSQRSGSSGVDLKDSVAIQLPFPTQLTDNTSIRLGAFERDMVSESVASLAANLMGEGGTTIGQGLGQLGSSLAKGFEQAGGLTSGDVGQVVSNLMESGKGVFSDLMDVEANKLTKAAAYLLRSKLPGAAGKSVDLVLKSTVNPRETLAFEGVNLKQHSFTWELFPSSKQDSNIIRNIVNTVKRNSLPSTENLLGGQGNAQNALDVAKAFLNYPATVDMYLLGVNTEHFMKFKTCMVADITVDYSGGGIVSILKGGVPAKVTLGMQFSELEIHTADDYPDGAEIPTTATESETPAEAG